MRQYPFSWYILRIYLLYTGFYRAIIQYSSRSRLSNSSRITLQFKCPQLYYTIINLFIALVGLVTYRYLPFSSRATQQGLLRLGFFARMGLQRRWCCLIGVLRSALLLVRQRVLLLGQVPQISFFIRLSTLRYLLCLALSPRIRFPVPQLWPSIVWLILSQQLLGIPRRSYRPSSAILYILYRRLRI